MGNGLCFFLFLVKRLEVFLIYNASELFVACGANQILGIDALVEANYLAARGALDLKVLVILVVTVTIAITIVAIAVTAIAAVAITIIILVFLVHEVLLYVAKILVDLLDVVVKLLNGLVKNADILCHLINKIDKSGNQLALGGLLVIVQTVGKTLQISSLLSKIHIQSPFGGQIE